MFWFANSSFTLDNNSTNPNFHYQTIVSWDGMFSQSKIELLAWQFAGAIGQLVSLDMWKFYQMQNHAKSIAKQSLCSRRTLPCVCWPIDWKKTTHMTRPNQSTKTAWLIEEKKRDIVLFETFWWLPTRSSHRQTETKEKYYLVVTNAKWRDNITDRGAILNEILCAGKAIKLKNRRNTCRDSQNFQVYQAWNPMKCISSSTKTWLCDLRGDGIWAVISSK